MIRLLLLAFFIFGSLLSSAQHRCGFDQFLEANPTYKEALINQTISFKNIYDKQKFRRDYKFSFDTTYELKVVFHIVYNTASENIPDSSIISQMEVLNEDFGRLNFDTTETMTEFLDVAGKLPFKFVLADTDPDGNPTDGIVRKQTNITAFTRTSGGQYDSRMKFDILGGSDAWDPQKYINIWVCDLQGTSGGGGLLGYATPPLGAENWPSNVQFPEEQQGAVIHYTTAGRYNPSAFANGANSLGRVCTHELGHYFGLFHTWGLQSNTCNESVDDFIDDTPNTRSLNRGCNLGNNTCFTLGGNDLPDMVQNYMDYSNGVCQNIYTKDQCALMFSNVQNFRPSIITPIVKKDSVFVGELVSKPFLLINPGSKLVIGADNYSNQTLIIDVYDLAGRRVLFDKQVEISEPREISELSGVSNARYITVIKNNNSGEVFTYIYVKPE